VGGDDGDIGGVAEPPVFVFERRDDGELAVGPSSTNNKPERSDLVRLAKLAAVAAALVADASELAEVLSRLRGESASIELSPPSSEAAVERRDVRRPEIAEPGAFDALALALPAALPLSSSMTSTPGESNPFETRGDDGDDDATNCCCCCCCCCCFAKSCSSLFAARMARTSACNARM
jgi:hypothetical protein